MVCMHTYEERGEIPNGEDCGCEYGAGGQHVPVWASEVLFLFLFCVWPWTERDEADHDQVVGETTKKYQSYLFSFVLFLGELSPTGVSDKGGIGRAQHSMAWHGLAWSWMDTLRRMGKVERKGWPVGSWKISKQRQHHDFTLLLRSMPA